MQIRIMPSARSGSVNNVSRWSTTPAKTRVRQVPQKPCWHEYGTDGFTRRTFIAMIEAVRPAALAAGLIEPASFDAGVDDLRRAAGPDGTFAYTFFKAVAVHR